MFSINRISVIGAGSWGTAVANLLAESKNFVSLYHYRADFIDELKSYSKSIGTGAIIGDSFMYLLATPLLYLYIQKNNINTNTFISIVCFYLIGYLIYQKPKISMK